MMRSTGSPSITLPMIYWATLLSFFLSCTRDTYLLNAPNPTLFERKGEKQLQINANGRSVQPQWGMSVSDKFSYQANGYLGFLGQSYLEGLGGTYFHTQRICLEAYTGLGYGYMDYLNGQTRDFTKEDISVYAHYLKIPLQLNLGVKFKTGARLFMVHRFSFLQYKHFSYEYTTYRVTGQDGYSTTVSAQVPSAQGLQWDFGIGLKAHNWIFQAGSSYSWLRIPHHLSQYTLPDREIFNEQTTSKSPYYLPFYLSVGYSIDFKNKNRGQSKAETGKSKRLNGEDIH